MSVASGSPPSDCRHCNLRNLCVFGALDNGDVDEFKSVRGPCVSVAAGSVLCHEGAPADVVFTIYDGWVLKYRHAEDGGRHGVIEAALEGGKADNSHKQRISELEKQVGDRDQVIGELTIANRILKKLSGESP